MNSLQDLSVVLIYHLEKCLMEKYVKFCLAVKYKSVSCYNFW